MLCNNCKIKSICKVYDIKKDKLGEINIKIDSCSYHASEIIQKSIDKAENNVNTFADSFDEEEYKKFLDKQNGVPDIDDDIIVTCSTCHGTCYQSDINICTKCGKEICANCGTASDGMNLCEKCWEEA